MSRAEELAEWLEFDDKRCLSNSKHLLGAAAELRRLSAVEAELIALKKAIGDAEPVAHLIERHSFYASQHGQDAEGRDWLEVTDQKEVGSFAVYTLKGIK